LNGPTIQLVTQPPWKPPGWGSTVSLLTVQRSRPPGCSPDVGNSAARVRRPPQRLRYGDVILLPNSAPLADNFVIMVAGLDRDSPLEQALAGGAPQRAGWFRLYFDGEQWEWSPEVQRLHGYEPGSITPTTALVLSHKHPEDYEQVAATLDDIRRTHQPFSTRRRIIDVQGHTARLSWSPICSETLPAR
jgi:hypothetical protein